MNNPQPKVCGFFLPRLVRCIDRNSDKFSLGSNFLASCFGQEAEWLGLACPYATILSLA